MPMDICKSVVKQRILKHLYHAGIQNGWNNPYDLRPLEETLAAEGHGIDLGVIADCGQDLKVQGLIEIKVHKRWNIIVDRCDGWLTEAGKMHCERNGLVA